MNAVQVIPTPVVICTEGAELLFGIIVERDDDRRAVTLSHAHVLLEQANIEDVCKLATLGPTKYHRVSKELLRIEICKVTCIINVTDDVAEVWANQGEE